MKRRPAVARSLKSKTGKVELSASSHAGKSVPAGLCPSKLRERIKPFRLYYFTTLRSTNDHAARMRREKRLFAPAVVATSRQTAGRGRGLHAWWSGRSCLTATIVIPTHDHIEPYHVPLLVGLAVRSAVVELTDDQSVQLKWPNDILWQGRKVAGLLCERLDRVDLIGVGLNVNESNDSPPDDLKSRIAFLNQLSGHPVDINTALVSLTRHIHEIISTRRHSSFSQHLEQYDQHHALVGKKVTILGHAEHSAMNGTCEGLDSMGRLIVRTATGIERIVSGNVLS